MFYRLLRLSLLLLLFLIHAGEAGAFNEQIDYEMEFSGKEPLLSSWTVRGRLKETENQFELMSPRGRMDYQFPLKDFELSFEYQTDSSPDSLLRLVLTKEGDTEYQNSGEKPPRKTFALPSKDHEVTIQIGDLSREWNQVVFRVEKDVIVVNYNGAKLKQAKAPGLWNRLSVVWKNAGKKKVRLRNLKLKEKGFVSLFNGKDFSGWEGAGAPAEKCWKVENGTLHGLRTKGPFLRSDQQYGDFRFRFEYQVEPGANSGVFIRVPADGKHHRKLKEEQEAGYEIQILDDTAKKFLNLREYQYGGSLYDIMGVNRLVGKPPGQWNSLEIYCDGGRIVTIHNGVQVVDAREENYPLMLLRKKKGFLGLQNHGGGVAFRHLRILDLN